jgi:ABC-type nitrate/sulfonate/bicarbonate transport system substrate-binding protein
MRATTDMEQAERLLESFAERARQEERIAYNRRQGFQSAAERISDARMDREDAEWAKRGKLAMPKPFDIHDMVSEMFGFKTGSR